jgi:hypothetical protein
VGKPQRVREGSCWGSDEEAVTLLLLLLPAVVLAAAKAETGLAKLLDHRERTMGARKNGTRGGTTGSREV